VLSKAILDIGLILCLLFVSACTSNSAPKKEATIEVVDGYVSYEDYPAWVAHLNNGLSKTKEISAFKYAIQYKPIEYILSKKNKDTLVASDFEDLHYIDLTLSHADYPAYLKIDLVAKNDYYARLKYFSFEIQNDLKLIDGADTLKCVFSHFERTYGITPYIKIVTAFEKNPTSKNDLYFTYHDQLFNNGIIILPVKQKALKNIPKIKNKHNG
jgi:hypothetical protein